MDRGHGWMRLALPLLVCLETAYAATACELPPLQDVAMPRMVYRLDETKNLVQFDAKAFMHDFAGMTSKVQGSIRQSDLDRLGDAEACVEIEAASLQTGISARDSTVRNDHLETAKHPTLKFRLAQVESVRRDAGGWEFTARGILRLHGVSPEILLPVRARQDGEAVRLAGMLPIKMSDYHIRIPKFLFIAVEDQVEVSFDVLARRAQ